MRIRSPLLIGLASSVFAKTMRALFWTLRLDLRVSQSANPYAASGEQKFLFSVWHDSIVIAAFGGPHRRTVALTSQHRDGTFVACVLKAIGVPVVRGSTGHRGDQAARQILKNASDKDIVITPDGPRGPKRVMSLGIVFLASRTGKAIVPTAFACHRAWAIRGSWTDLIIPKPFSRVFLVAGEPILVPDGLAREDLEVYASQVQSQMDQLEARAQALVADLKQ